MWNNSFEHRLKAWSALRTSCENLPLEEALQTINDWWFQAPWRQYLLHWDDIETWPDPWQLLDDNVFCELARGLGILYTLSMITHKEIQSAELALTSDDYNIVLVNRSYILNWDPKVAVNTSQNTVKRKLTLEQLKQLYK